MGDLHPSSDMLIEICLCFFIFSKILFVYLLERERVCAGGGADGEAENLQQTPSKHRTRYRARSRNPEIMTCAETES